MKLKARLTLTVYQVLTALIAPLGLCWLMHKKRRDPPYGRRRWELLGFMPVHFKSTVWFHAVSVGEVIAARPVITAFVKRHPSLNVVVTTTTTTGAAAAAKIPGITHLYAPLDSPCAVRRFFVAVKPRQLFIMETELWPNLLHEAQKRGTQVTVFNARLPEHTCKAYEKHLTLVKELIAAPLNLVICQTPEDAARFVRIGLPPERVFAVNSLKYDLQPNEARFAEGRAIKRALPPAPAVGALSTHDGEEALVLEQFARLYAKRPELRLILVPRHLSSADLAEECCQKLGLHCQRRTALSPDLHDLSAPVLIGDTIGEMELYLGLCDLVFLGGSLVDIGGHNPLEPAYFSLPIITGPFFYNFKEQFERLFKAGGAFLCKDPAALTALTAKLMDDKAALKKAGEQALHVQQAGRGALKKTLELLEKALERPAGR